MDDEPEITDEKEALRKVEEEVAGIRRENSRLEHRLTRGVELQRFALMGAMLASFAAVASYWTALHGSCAANRAYHEAGRHAVVHEERMADERAIEDACLETSKKASAELAECREQRTRADMNDRFRRHMPSSF